RMPLVRDSATFSAASRQIEQRRNSASPSTHSLRFLSNVRGVDATVKFATAAPAGVYLSSGAPVRFPITVIAVSPAIIGLQSASTHPRPRPAPELPCVPPDTRPHHLDPLGEAGHQPGPPGQPSPPPPAAAHALAPGTPWTPCGGL